ncbi:kinase-like domain-containing protein [Phellopilus nigrolimitatus]|nr:kinase-like domain-containing protein [Phellopilus nigrolimitatus]
MHSSLTRIAQRLVREVRAWSKLYHRNVLQLLGFTYGFDTASSRLASLVSPWMPNGTATRYLRNCSSSERIRVLTSVADGLCYLHRHDVVHGDLKGDNILIDERREPHLADFGLSKLLTEVNGDAFGVTQTASFLGSVRWMARELFDFAVEPVPSSTCESDVWAFGMTMIELFTGAPPYHHLRSDPQVIIQVHAGILPNRPAEHTGFDDDLWDLCMDCWAANPKLRPSTQVIAKRLWSLELRCTHPLFFNYRIFD